MKLVIKLLIKEEENKIEIKEDKNPIMKMNQIMNKKENLYKKTL